MNERGLPRNFIKVNYYFWLWDQAPTKTLEEVLKNLNILQHSAQSVYTGVKNIAHL